MPTAHLDIELLTDTSFRASSATTGAGDTLTTLPGATLWGCLAAAFSADPRFEKAILMGGISVSDGLPLVGDAVAWPVPLCLHHDKGAQTDGDFEVHNLFYGRDGLGQQEPLKQGHLTEGGRWLRLDKQTRRSLRTALDETGRPREHLLYYLDAVPAGTRYTATLSAADDGLLSDAVRALVGVQRLGRSRGAELGRVRISERRASRAQEASGDARSTDLHLLLLTADAALRDPTTGAPCTAPTAAALGIDEFATVDAAQSFVRYRAYSPFNGHRKRPEAERQVLVAGSVIALRCEPKHVANLRDALKDGIGEHRHTGLGAVRLDPMFLAAKVLAVHQPDEAAPAPAPLPAKGPNAVLSQRVGRAVAEAAARNSVEHWLAQAVPALCRLRPGPAQWGNVRGIALSHREKDPETLIEALKLEFEIESRPGLAPAQPPKSGAAASAAPRSVPKGGVTAVLWNTPSGSRAPITQLLVALSDLNAALAEVATRQRKADGSFDEAHRNAAFADTVITLAQRVVRAKQMKADGDERVSETQPSHASTQPGGR